MRILSYILIIFICITCFLCGSIFFLAHYPLIDISALEQPIRAQPSIVLDDKGDEWTRFQLDRREPILLQHMPKHLINAFIATEDHDFFQHSGISWRGIVRSLWVNIRKGRFVQGASTITQQLVRLTFLSHEKTFTRKIKEQLTSFIIEYQCTKEQILETYINIIYCGAGTYGAQAAAQRFWKKNVDQLSLAQCALLAGLAQSPSNYCPMYEKNQERCLTRRNLVLSRMLHHDVITQKEYDTAIKEPLNVHMEKDQTLAPHAREMVRQHLEQLVGRDRLYAGGLIIKTTLNQKIQKQAERTFKRGISVVRPKAPLDGALIMLDASNAAIKALVGGYDFEESQFNRATQAQRQIGSIFKTFVYATALQQGSNLTQLEVDEPLTSIKNWDPHNVHKRFEGPMTLAWALATSNNIIAIKTFLKVGAEAVIKLAQACHIPGPFVPYPSLALGCTECSVLQATAAYATLVNQGNYQEPYLIEWVKDSWGTKLWKHEAISEQVLSPAISSQLVQALQLVPSLLKHRYSKPWVDVESIGKTGTTNKMTNCWYMGATPNYVTGIYIGCDDNRSLQGIVSSTQTVVPMWLELNKNIVHAQKNFYLDPYLKMVHIHPRTGEMLAKHEPKGIDILIP